MANGWRGVAGRPDALLAAVFVLGSLAQVVWLQPVRPLSSPSNDWFGPVLAVVSMLPLAWRRSRPAVAAILGSSLWWVPTDAFLLLGYVAAIILFYSLGRWCRSLRRGLLACGWALTSGTLGILAIEQEIGLADLLLGGDARRIGEELPGAPTLLGVLGFWLLLLGSFTVGRWLAHQDRASDRRVAEEREAAGREAASSERARIVRELHDVVGHEVTLMSIHSEAAAQALELAPDRAAEPIAAVRETAQRAGRELRAILDLLGGGELAVVPDGRGLEELVERAQRLGIANRLEVTGTPWEDAPRHWLAVNRIVQECLTNAGKHAPGERVDVRVDWSPEGVVIRVDNAASAQDDTGPGRGVLGMAERARLLGGTLTAERVEGRFEVVAQLPAGGGRAR
ncbi:sensor histidine kinase [Nocardioides piscis]|uniref:histidine kinase n=1 Tax=Nocardioides piscis TaxID=2714938 RepID=A0A6G7YDA1_9ACTN|nr:histidine kinase [Nocardioides piscis]QIK74587.1 hypothetical protein G7071_03215 [Nocardioides piscis]